MPAKAPKPVVAIYIRVTQSELERLRTHPDVLPKYDPRVALGDGRGLDLGRAWEDLGVFLDGGVKLPEVGPTVGEHPLPETDSRATWSYVEPARVAVLSEQLSELRHREFRELYQVDSEDTQPSFPGARTGGYGDRDRYMFSKLRELGAHYAEAARRGEAMLVRIGERV